MPRNGSGTYSLPAGNPVTTGTTISSTTHNSTLSDIASALTASLTKDGQTTPTANIPMGGFKLTGLANAAAVDDAVRASQIQNGSLVLLGSVAGTNTVTATAAPVPAAYASGQRFILVPAVTNTAATTLDISSLGAKNVFANGAACVGGELIANVPVEVEYDGTQFNILSVFPKFKVVTFTRDVSTASGSQAVTGVGFKPKGGIFVGGINGTVAMSVGVDDQAARGGIYDNSVNVSDTYGSGSSASITAQVSAGNVYQGSVSTWDADGFTILWTKTGSPTGTLTATALLFR